MGNVAIAAGSQMAADAGRQVAETGGNAVDAAIAATLVLMIAEPGICAPGAGGFLTVLEPGAEPVTIDANVAMPGAGASADRFGRATHVVDVEYGGGFTTTVGYESIATPGGIAGLGAAWSRFGACPWAEVVAPAIAWADRGTPLSRAARYYLEYTHESIFGWHPISRAALHDGDRLLEEGEAVRVPGLADTLTRLADAGAADAYTGDIAAVLASDLDQGGSLVTAEDLTTYRPSTRSTVESRIGSWRVASNPPPSIGGVSLTAMLQLLDADTPRDVPSLISAQERVLRYRRNHLDLAEDLDAATHHLLAELTTDDQHLVWRSSPSTVHVSAVGDDGTACAVTMSAGYGSGAIAGQTGFWMNNSLGEAELNRRGYHALPVGERLPSNMAPTVATRDDGAVLAIGSPGADRITTALQQVLAGLASGMTPQEAIDAPRLHVDVADDSTVVSHEPGLVVPEHHTRRQYQSPHMFFGGVAAAMLDPEHGLVGAADGRRAGGVAISGTD